MKIRLSPRLSDRMPHTTPKIMYATISTVTNNDAMVALESYLSIMTSLSEGTMNVRLNIARNVSPAIIMMGRVAAFMVLLPASHSYDHATGKAAAVHHGC